MFETLVRAAAECVCLKGVSWYVLVESNKILDSVQGGLQQRHLNNAGFELIIDTYRDAGLFQRLTLIEEEFPGTCALLLKEGKIHKAYCDLWVNDRLLNVMEQLVGPEIAGNPLWNLRPKEPNCNNTYIGETSRPLKVRYKEHCRPSANGCSSAIFHHLQHNQGHSFKLESTDVLDRETRWWERGVKEAIYERMYNPTLNREGGLRVDLSGTWDLALPAPRTDNT
ncbi:hypothetical protein Bbelb_425090 [Branchiostoma belcheri]|nr:hypothetical protein Bbelb_425090 [Branchiostoma belcheri]